MRKLYLSFMLLSFMACNNNKSETTTTTGDSAAATTGKQPETSAGRCASLYMFKEGTVVENVSYDNAGKETSRQVSKVIDVTGDGGNINSEVEMKSSGEGSEHTFIGKYRCDGNNLYVDLSGLFANIKEEGAKIEGDPIVFPLNLSEGQTLPDAQYSFSINRDGQQMKTTAMIRNRKVEGRETVTTPAGTFNCYKISSDIEANIELPGMNDQMKKMMEEQMKKMPKNQFVMYYDPSVSIVKVEMYSGGKLQNRSIITSIK
jgi:hypothetical protein